MGLQINNKDLICTFYSAFRLQS